MFKEVAKQKGIPNLILLLNGLSSKGLMVIFNIITEGFKIRNIIIKFHGNFQLF